MSAPRDLAGRDIVESRWCPVGQMYGIGNRLIVHAPQDHSRVRRFVWRLRHPFTRCPLKVEGGIAQIRTAFGSVPVPEETS